MSEIKIIELYGGENAEQYNVLMTAIKECSKDNDEDVYAWLENTPKTSLVTFLIDKLQEMGYEIKKK
jgi:hypothetical protein